MPFFLQPLTLLLADVVQISTLFALKSVSLRFKFDNIFCSVWYVRNIWLAIFEMNLYALPLSLTHSVSQSVRVIKELNKTREFY